MKNIMDQTKKQRNPHVNIIINKIVDKLRRAGHPLLLNEIEKLVG